MHIIFKITYHFLLFSCNKTSLPNILNHSLWIKTHMVKIQKFISTNPTIYRSTNLRTYLIKNSLKNFFNYFPKHFLNILIFKPKNLNPTCLTRKWLDYTVFAIHTPKRAKTICNLEFPQHVYLLAGYFQTTVPIVASPKSPKTLGKLKPVNS